MPQKKTLFSANSYVISIVVIIQYYYCTSIKCCIVSNVMRCTHSECQRPIQCFLHVTLQLAIKIGAQTIITACGQTGFRFHQFSLITLHRHLVSLVFEWSWTSVQVYLHCLFNDNIDNGDDDDQIKFIFTEFQNKYFPSKFKWKIQ